MSDENGSPPGPTPPPGDQSPPQQPGPGQHQPNWGSAYPPPPQYPPPGYGPAYQSPPPKHGQATMAMVFGIIGLAGSFACVVPILLAPVAWIVGAKAVKEIDANPGSFSGRGEANAGKILGIIGTVLLILGLIVLTIIIIVAVNGGFDDSYDDNYNYDFIGQLA